MDEIFDEIFDEIYRLMEINGEETAKTKTIVSYSRMLEYELDGTWHLGSLKKKHQSESP